MIQIDDALFRLAVDTFDYSGELDLIDKLSTYEVIKLYQVIYYLHKE